jgi:hypothetical protein
MDGRQTEDGNSTILKASSGEFKSKLDKSNFTERGKN